MSQKETIVELYSEEEEETSDTDQLKEKFIKEEIEKIPKQKPRGAADVLTKFVIFIFALALILLSIGVSEGSASLYHWVGGYTVFMDAFRLGNITVLVAMAICGVLSVVFVIALYVRKIGGGGITTLFVVLAAIGLYLFLLFTQAVTVGSNWTVYASYGIRSLSLLFYLGAWFIITIAQIYYNWKKGSKRGDELFQLFWGIFDYNSLMKTRLKSFKRYLAIISIGIFFLSLTLMLAGLFQDVNFTLSVFSIIAFVVFQILSWLSIYEVFVKHKIRSGGDKLYWIFRIGFLIAIFQIVAGFGLTVMFVGIWGNYPLVSLITASKKPATYNRNNNNNSIELKDSEVICVV